MLFSSEELTYYQRQFVLDEVGVAGQEKLRRSRVLVIGAGGLGCPALLYLCTAGIGTIGLIDHDTIQTNNLHRQILYRAGDEGKLKATVAGKALRGHNPSVSINEYPFRLAAHNALTLMSDYDIVVDATDNFETKYIIDDACAASNKPLISGALYKFSGQVSVFHYRGAGSYRNLFPNASLNNPNCGVDGVLGVTCGVVGSIMAAEVIKVVLTTGKIMNNVLLEIDLLSMTIVQLGIPQQI